MDDDDTLFEPTLIVDLPTQANRTYDDHTHSHLQVIIIILLVMLWRVW